MTKALTDAGTAGLPKTISSDVLVLRTSAFTQQLAETLGGEVDQEEIRASLQTQVIADVGLIEVHATASQADSAADLANAAAEQFIEVRQEETRELLRSALGFVRDRLDSLTPAEQTSDLRIELAQYEFALERLLRSPVADYKILERATPPSSPYTPRPLINMLLGAAAGLVIGILLALLVNSLDRRVRDRSTLERVLDLPTLGAIPTTRGKRGGKPVVGFGQNSEALLDSLKALRTNLKVLGFGETKRTVLITSTDEGEERSALAVDLTLTMALSGDRVILVDADLRGPKIHEYLGIPNTQGLGDVLTGAGTEWSELIQPVDLLPYVDKTTTPSAETSDTEPTVSKFLCLTSGTRPDDPAAALGSGVLPNLLAELQGYSDYVIVDGPPATTVSDSLILARSVDAVIVTSTLRGQTVAETRQVRQLLARAEIEPLGVVLCGTRGRAH